MIDSGAEQLGKAMRKLSELGLNVGTSGNVSVRQTGGMLITPSAVPVSLLTPDLIVRVSEAGKTPDGKRPSSEWPMHLAIYAARPDVFAIAHCHSRYATALSTLREVLPDFHYLVAQFGGDEVPCTNYASFGTESLGRNVVEALGELRACLIANHGQICVGHDLDEAVNSAIELEELCAQYCIARTMGTPVRLGAEEMRRMQERFRDYKQR